LRQSTKWHEPTLPQFWKTARGILNERVKIPYYDNMTFEEFKKVDLRVAKIVSAEKVPDSEKLLRLEINCGDKNEAGESVKRQVVSGIAKSYAPENLIGKEILIVANLEPRQLMGLTSNGMLLAARNADGQPVILIPEKEVAAGTEIG